LGQAGKVRILPEKRGRGAGAPEEGLARFPPLGLGPNQLWAGIKGRENPPAPGRANPALIEFLPKKIGPVFYLALLGPGPS